jgi:hypothetical protein
LAVATRTETMKPSDLARVVSDTTVQPKAVMFPTDAKLLNLSFVFRHRLFAPLRGWACKTRTVKCRRKLSL